MSEPRNLTLRSQLVGEEKRLVSIGGASRLIWEDLGKVAGLYDVTVQSDCPRNVVNFEQIMDAPNDGAIRTRVESARGESLMDGRRLNLVINRDPSFLMSWTVNDSTCLRVDCCQESYCSPALCSFT